MSRTVELGRAVLSSPVSKLELWLTTLITVSQAQKSIGLNQLGEQDLVTLLSSGDVWIGRGKGMHLAFDITTQREALASCLTRQLADRIIAAPAWKYLKLQPSVCLEQPLSPGKLHLKLDLSRQDDGIATKKIPLALSSTQIEDCIPPEGVPTLEIQSVKCLLNITEIRARVVAPRSQQMRVIRDGLSIFPKNDALMDKVDDEESAMLFDAALKVDINQGRVDNTSEMLFEHDTENASELNRASEAPRVHSSDQPILTQKRACGKSTRALSELSPPRRKRQRGTASAVGASETENTHSMTESERFAIMIDAAVRISVFGNLRGSPGIVKIKASTFVETLAVIAPFLWRPGYRAAMAATSGFNPALSLSVARVSSRAKSGALCAKINSISSALSQETVYQDHANVRRSLANSRVSSQLAAKFWIKAQKALLSKPAPAWIHGFCALGVQPRDDINADEVLEGHCGQPANDTEEFGSCSMTRSAPKGHTSGHFGNLCS